MGVMLVCALTGGGLGGWMLGVLEKYSITSHGANPWTLDGIFNLGRVYPHVERILAEVGGQVTSFWRSDLVNQLTKGHSETSRHLRGLACDLVPTVMTAKGAAGRIHDLAVAGLLGPVKQVWWETRNDKDRAVQWVHVEWWAADETAKPPALGRLVDNVSTPWGA